MSTARMHIRDASPPRLAAGAALLALCAVARGQEPAVDAPVGLPAHAMLEDPLNRSFLFDELETYDDATAWDATMWAGYSFNKLMLRTAGEKDGGTTESAELELLWSHAVTRWWDVVAGARTDFQPDPTRSWAAFGVHGLAPQRFTVEATAYVGDGGDSAARFEGEYELLITPRLVLQPQLEIDWYGQADDSSGLGPGLSTAEAALRLRYELRREVAPYVALIRARKFGATADRARADGRDSDDTRFAVGIRLRF